MTSGHRSGRASQILAEVIALSARSDAAPGHLVSACARSVPVTGAGLSVMTESGPGGMLAASDNSATVLEHLQFTLGEGPCIDSARTGRPVLDADLERSGNDRWPRFTAGALDAGVRAVFAFPLSVGGIQVGVLDLYRDSPGTLSSSAIGEAESYADAAARLLLHLHAEQPLDDRGPGWTAAIENRSGIHQATGMISVQSGVSLADALLLLRARAFASERPLDAVARDVVDRVLRFPAERDDPR